MTLLNYGGTAKTTYLTSGLWVKDTAGNMDDTADANVGLVSRRKIFNHKQEADLLGSVHCDLFN